MLHQAATHGRASYWRLAIGLASLLFAVCPGVQLWAQPGGSNSSGELEITGEVIQRVQQHLTGEILDSVSETLPPATPSKARPPQPADQQTIPLVQAQPIAEGTIHHEEGNISLMVRDASLRQVVALIAETQNLNLVFATTAETPVTASFDRVPWQQVLDSLLSASGHIWTTNNDVIMITSIENADLLPPMAGGRQVEVVELDFASSVEIDQAVKGLLSPSGKSWIMETSSDDNRRTREAIIVVDYPSNLAQIMNYICAADQPPRQVLIEANILEVELDCDCRSGINWDALGVSTSGNELNLRTVGFANPASSTAFFLQATGGAVESLVELLQTSTDAKTLASPKVLAVSGQEARMQVGEQLGFRVVTTTQTSTLEEVQFLDVGVVLSVVPRVTRDGRVLMRIKPEVSTGQVDPETGLPSEETTEVETDILLSDGQGMVIGGLIQEQDINSQSKVPWIGDLPYVGILFQKRLVQKKRTEIIVTLVPHVQPYKQAVAEHEAHQFMRTQDRLTTGPLDLTYRPYEAQLPDTFRNPRRPLHALHTLHSQAHLHRLPPVEELTRFPVIDVPYGHLPEESVSGKEHPMPEYAPILSPITEGTTP